MPQKHRAEEQSQVQCTSIGGLLLLLLLWRGRRVKATCLVVAPRQWGRICHWPLSHVSTTFRFVPGFSQLHMWDVASPSPSRSPSQAGSYGVEFGLEPFKSPHPPMVSWIQPHNSTLNHGFSYWGSSRGVDEPRVKVVLHGFRQRTYPEMMGIRPVTFYVQNRCSTT